MNTSIEWTDVTWNPVRGCALVSAGCTNCYAMRIAHRFGGPGQPYAGLTERGPQGPRWNGTIRLVPEALGEPLHWKRPRRVFVNSMSDLFHENVPFKFIHAVFDTIRQTPHLIYQILTKRPERMREFMTHYLRPRESMGWANGFYCHVWLGVSVEDQATADERIPILLQTPAAVRWISAEPLLGPVDLSRSLLTAWERSETRDGGLDWVIIGGESGPGARPCDLAWIRSIKDQCQAAAVPVFVKQLGTEPRGLCAWEHHASDPPDWLDDDGTLLSVSGSQHGDLCHAMDDAWWPCKPQFTDRKGGTLSEWPADLRVREWPGVRSETA